MWSTACPNPPIKMLPCARYTTELLNVPGMKFRVDIDDPKERIQAYIDEYATPPKVDGHFEVG